MTQEIESTYQGVEIFNPSQAFIDQATINNFDAYKTLYDESVNDPEGFWGRMAEENLEWIQKWDTVLDYDFDTLGTKEAPYVSFFKGGKLNISHNCLDRHINAGNGDRIAFHWQGEDPAATLSLSYKDVHKQVCQISNALRAQGVQKGSVVTIYMPMIPQLPIAMQACARIGAIHSVVFSAFSPDALSSRVNDCGSEYIITADSSVHGGKEIPVKIKVDQALKDCSTIKKVIVYNRGNTHPEMDEDRDIYWQTIIDGVSAECEPEPMDAEDPLFILYTSGSTGKPKGVLHTTAGYLLFTHLTTKYVFDVKPETDVFWCTADAGWITGHSYLAYGPLSNGITSVMFEGVPTYPEADRFWQIVEDFKVSIFYTAPTAIRALMRLGEEWPNKHDLSSLRLLGSVGEPINPEAWLWYHRVIGKENCPIIDTWWQTETGGHMLLTLPGAMGAKPGAAGFPFFGVVPKLIRTDGSEADVNEGGSLCITEPWPGMIRGVYGDPTNELVKNVYFSTFDGVYFSGDGCRVDDDGYYWLMGRMDDVVNVSGHRFSTAEFESALVGHTAVAEAAVVGYPHDIKGQGIYCYVTLKEGIEATDELKVELVKKVRSDIGPIASPDKIQFSPSLPKTRSGKIMRRILRKIADGTHESIGDTSTLADPSVVDDLVTHRQ